MVVVARVLGAVIVDVGVAGAVTVAVAMIMIIMMMNVEHSATTMEIKPSHTHVAPTNRQSAVHVQKSKSSTFGT